LKKKFQYRPNSSALFLIVCVFFALTPVAAENRNGASATAEDSRGLRKMVLNLSPRDINIVPTQEHPRVWGVLMETGYQEDSVSLVALLDGTVSLYFSEGGGIIGAGEYERVRKRALKLVGVAENYVEDFSKTAEYSFPQQGAVKFYLLTFSGVFTADANEDDLGGSRHKLSKLFYAAHDVITEIRLMQERGELPGLFE
jgi:hypothetical protein